MGKLFISHSSQDDGFVHDLRAALADHGQDGVRRPSARARLEVLQAAIERGLINCKAVHT